jgi:hypothetical protein
MQPEPGEENTTDIMSISQLAVANGLILVGQLEEQAWFVDRMFNNNWGELNGY